MAHIPKLNFSTTHADKGATPWIWSCALFDHPEEYKKYIGVDDAVLSPWYYNAFRKEHYTPITSRAEYVAYYNEGEYAKMGLKYVEEDPFLVNFRNVALPLMKEGYRYVCPARQPLINALIIRRIWSNILKITHRMTRFWAL